MALNNHLNQSWLNISEVLWHLYEDIFFLEKLNISVINFKMFNFRSQLHLPGANEFMLYMPQYFMYT